MDFNLPKPYLPTPFQITFFTAIVAYCGKRQIILEEAHRASTDSSVSTLGLIQSDLRVLTSTLLTYTAF
jgi:hypothetical protein